MFLEALAARESNLSVSIVQILQQFPEHHYMNRMETRDSPCCTTCQVNKENSRPNRRVHRDLRLGD